MHLNPYHFILLKRLITIEVQRFYEKQTITYEDIRTYIISLKAFYNGDPAETFAEYIIRRVWRKDVFNFSEKVLDKMCMLLVTTRKYTSWHEFEIVHANHFAKIAELYMNKAYFKLDFEDKERINNFVDTTCGIYIESNFSEQEKFAELYDTVKIAENIIATKKSNLRLDLSLIKDVLQFVKTEKSRLVRMCFYVPFFVSSIYKDHSIGNIIRTILWIAVTDLAIFFILTSTAKNPPYKILAKMVAFLLLIVPVLIITAIAEVFQKPTDDLFLDKFLEWWDALDDDEDGEEEPLQEAKDYTYSHYTSFKISFPLRIQCSDIVWKANNEHDYMFINKIRNLGADIREANNKRLT